MGKTKSYISVYLSEDLKNRLDKVAENQQINRNKLITNILAEVVQDFETVQSLPEKIAKDRIFFVSRYL